MPEPRDDRLRLLVVELRQLQADLNRIEEHGDMSGVTKQAVHDASQALSHARQRLGAAVGNDRI